MVFADVKDFAIGAYNLLGGHYGKELKDGQYWQPYATTSISNKLDADLLFLFSEVKKVDFRGKNIFCGFCFESGNGVFANDTQGFGEIGDKKSILM